MSGWKDGVRPADEHFPVFIGVRAAHASSDAVQAIATLKRGGFAAAPIGTLAVASLAVIRLRAAMLEFPDPDTRDNIINICDELEGELVALKDGGIT